MRQLFSQSEGFGWGQGVEGTETPAVYTVWSNKITGHLPFYTTVPLEWVVEGQKYSERPRNKNSAKKKEYRKFRDLQASS